MIGKITEIIDTDKPILIDGWNKTKTLFPSQKITNKRISDNIFWTFSEKEKRSENVSDLEKFKTNCIVKFESKYKYYFINPFEIGYTNVKKIINKVDGEKNGFYHFDGRDFFILIDNIIFGIDIEFLGLTTINKNKIENWLKNKNFKLFDDNQIFNIKSFMNKKYLLPAIKKEIEHEKEFIIGYILE